jgi:serine phosphatase RsbU (regulator of sigma subunit)
MYRLGDLLPIEDSWDDPRVSASTVWRYGTRAVLAVPVVLPGQILGSLQFIWAGSPRVFKEAEIDFARKLTTSLALALENARLHEEQKNIAQRLQQALLDIPEQTRGVQFGHLYRSATKEASVGGDFYDVFAVKEGRIAVLIGDVSGHGVEAARLATMVKDVVHAFAHQFRRPSVVLRKTNELLVEKQTPGFVTLFLGVLDPEGGLLTYSSAGHPNALVRGSGNEVEPLRSGSAPLGVFGRYSWKDHDARLDKEDLLLLYTDGVIEARRDGEFFGQAGIANVLGRWPESSPEMLPQAVLSEVLAYSRGVLSDDVAILALRLSGDAAPE